MSLFYGSDSYGRVKDVDGTSIVTQFAMYSSLPLWPLQSYYRAGADIVASEGIPLLFHMQSVHVQGFPLRRLDRLSVIMAYVRGIAGALIAFGSISMVPGVMWLMGERLDRVAMAMTFTVLGMLAAGIILGAGSYAWPFQITRRERNIRTLCGRVLGHSIDPSLVTAECADYIVAAVEEKARALVRQDALSASVSKRDAQMYLRFVRVRAAIALGGERQTLEAETDDLVIRLAEVVSGR